MSATTDPLWCLAPLTTRQKLADDIVIPRPKGKVHRLPGKPAKARPAPVLPYNDKDSLFFCRKAKRRYREATIPQAK